MWQFWVDRGGTFTDIVACRPDGTLVTSKYLSENLEQYPDAAVYGIRRLLGLNLSEPIPTNTIAAVKMGTTVATNALLERKGDRTLLLITKGFKDLLRIGYQNRPKLFALHIQLPTLLYEKVAEVDERVDAAGEVVTALDLTEVRVALEQAYADGIRSVAIALMHGYLMPMHEQRVAELAREIGFTQISTSHETSPLIKLVSRGDTTVVDAYLTPILRRYIDQVNSALGVDSGCCEKLMFMQSNGGLTDAGLFQGKDSILSGPAGGVVGMVRTAKQAGYEQVIGFDMGGTSTDVCHFAGEYERSFETEVAGVRMRAPMMHIHTVAAGGGSILSYRDGRYQVGPESAGADPGPASYRRGGPLTVTDCNVLLGKLQPSHFPRVFGPDACDPLDKRVVDVQFAQLAESIALKTGVKPLSPEKTAEGFLQIAVENMANAIKKISVQRGYDVTRYTLNCFGGAGGQHACLVADALGIDRVFLHPLAGVLSAYGMGLADVRALREHQYDVPFADALSAKALLTSLSNDAQDEVAQQGIDKNKIEILRRIHLRYEGSHQALIVPYDSLESMQSKFESDHQSRFGFIAENRKLRIEAVSVEAIGYSGTVNDELLAESSEGIKAIDQVSMYCGGDWQTVPLYDREQLGAGQRVMGPCIVVESTGTNVIESGWAGTINAYGHLILQRVEKRQQHRAIGTEADPIMLEVFNNLFMNIAEQMGGTLANTAYSVNIKERLDFSCALFDADGELVANAPHVPVHLGSMSEAVRTVNRVAGSTMGPGDVYVLNNPFNGGTHLPDVTVITPVFDRQEENILFYVGSRGHHADIGGLTPGSAPPNSTHIEQEGVVIDAFKLVENGRLRDEETRELLGSGEFPCRNIDHNMADLAAQVAANETGVREVNKMIDQFGLKVVHAYMGHVQDNAEESVRQVISALKDGDYTFTLDHGAHIKVAIRVDRTSREAVIDFTGTSNQQRNNYNSPLAVCHAVVLYVFRTLVDADIPLNAGCLKPLHIIAPDCSMINPHYPAAVISGNTEVSQAIADCMFGALGVIAGSQATMNNFVWGTDEFQNYDTICGGAGAGPDFPGASAVQIHMTNTRSTDPEILEKRFPVRIEEFSIRDGSGGQGHYPGGDGCNRNMRALVPMKVTVLSSHRITQAFGINGGEPGAVGVNEVYRANGETVNLGGNDEIDLNAGDVFSVQTPGGGGSGSVDS